MVTTLEHDNYSDTADNVLIAYLNNLRARSLLSFVAVVLQIPAGWGLQWILDHKTWGRRKRGLIALTAVSAPMIVAWVWEIIRVRNYNRSQPPTDPTDWVEPRFGWIFVLFMLTWVSCVSITKKPKQYQLV